MTEESSIYLNQITIKGFKSIKALECFPLSNLNLLIGANGAGKSNFIKALTLLNPILEKKLQLWIGREGGVDDICHFGQKITSELQIAWYHHSSIGQFHYQCTLIPAHDTLIFAQETGSWQANGAAKSETFLIDGGHSETHLYQLASNNSVAQTILDHLKNGLFKFIMVIRCKNINPVGV